MTPFSPVVRPVILLGMWLAWAGGLVALRKNRWEKAVQVDSTGRWGMALQMAGYAIVCSHGPSVWRSDLEVWRAAVGMVLGLLSTWMFWNAVANLGKQWRFDAGLNREHELIQKGAYRIVRHPIYCSMLGMFLTDACVVGTVPGWAIALMLFLTGTEIRVRVEDDLLRKRFGERFTEWQRSEPAYVPFIR